MKKNVLIFPAGSVSAIEIYNSLKYSVHFNVYGATSIHDYAEYIFTEQNLIVENLQIKDSNFIDNFNKLLFKWKIDYIIPTHDVIAGYLIKNQEKIWAEIVCSPTETSVIAENKYLTYMVFKEENYYPKVFTNIDENIEFPVFLKPHIGAGGKGTFVARSKNELQDILLKHRDLLIVEYLPGSEYTVDCFTDRKGNLLFSKARERERIEMGISFRAKRFNEDNKISEIANLINSKLKFRGAWFFQLKKDNEGNLKLLEISVRQAGTMVFFRPLGINFTLLSLFDRMDYDLEILFNDLPITLDRTLKNSFKINFEYKNIYIDFDDTLIVNDRVNTKAIQLIYQAKNQKQNVYLITRHKFSIFDSLKKYCIDTKLFSDIIVLKNGELKSRFIKSGKSIFIDNLFLERKEVKEKLNIPVFDVDAIDSLIEDSSI